MFKLTILLSCICVIIQKGDCECKPKFIVPGTESIPDSVISTECNFESSADCTNIRIIEYIRWSAVNQTWDVALEYVQLSNSPDFKTLIDGYTLDGRTIYLDQTRFFRLGITRTIIDDSGLWRCSVIDDTGERFLSDQEELRITNGELYPENITVTRVESGIFVLSEEYTYWCSSPSVYPRNVDFDWIPNNNGGAGTDFSDMNGYVWTVNYTTKIAVNSTTVKEIKCVISKKNGVVWSGENTWELPNITYKPALIESVNEGKDNLYVECVASGDNISISWTIDDEPWDKTMFEEEQTEITGIFAYGQTSALRSRLIFLQDNACTYKEELKGPLQCTVSGYANPSIKSLVLNFSSCDHFPWWAIVLICLFALAASAGIALLMSWCCCKKKFVTFFRDKVCCCCQGCCCCNEDNTK